MCISVEWQYNKKSKTIVGFSTKIADSSILDLRSFSLIAQFQATYSHLIIQNPVVSKGQPPFFWWWKQLSLVWKEQFSTLLEIAEGSPDCMWLSQFPQTGPWHPGNSLPLEVWKTWEWGLTADNRLSATTHFPSVHMTCYRPAHFVQSRNADVRNSCSLKVTLKLNL